MKKITMNNNNSISNNNNNNNGGIACSKENVRVDTIINLHEPTNTGVTTTTTTATPNTVLAATSTAAVAAANTAHNNIINTVTTTTPTATLTTTTTEQDNVEVKSLKNSKNNSVNIQTSLRTNFKKSNTCGSLFAKCACNSSDCDVDSYLFNFPFVAVPAISTATHQNGQTPEPALNEGGARNNNNNINRKKLYQSYSHPDTGFIFTDKNKLPKSNSEKLNTNANHRICTKTGVEIHSKRLSSPNIGNYTQLDIAIHPDFLVKVQKPAKKKQQHRYQQNSIDSVSSFDESTTEDDEAESIRLQLKYAEIVTNSDEHAFFDSGGVGITPTETKVTKSTQRIEDETEDYGNDDNTSVNNNNKNKKNNCCNIVGAINNNNKRCSVNNCSTVAAEAVLDAAQFIKESGILGPAMGNAISGLFRKHSKVIPLHQSPQQQQQQQPQQREQIVTKEQIRRNSLVLMKQISDMRRKSITDDYEYLRNNVIPNLKRELSEYEIKVATSDDEITSLRAVIRSRDEEILKLKTEIHKLKSVLQQTAATPISPTANDNSLLNVNNNLPAIVEQISGEQFAVTDAYQNVGGGGGGELEEDQESHLVGNKRPNTHLPVPQQLVKKQGVSGESCDTARQTVTDISIQKYDKDFRSKQLIKDAIMDNDFLKHIDSLQIRELVESMYSREFSTGEYVIREGEVGAHLFVSAEGEFEVIKNGTSLGTMGPGKAFGELAILYNCTRTATIRAKNNSRVWVLDRRVYQHIMMRTGIQRMEENVSFLKSVSLLRNLSNDVLTKIADVLEVEFYPANAYIIRQGASGDTFFLISQGTVKVTQRVPGSPMEEEIRILTRGEYFGEQALIKEDKRTANIIAMSPGVECLTLDRDSFTQLIGNFCEEIHLKDYGDQTRAFATKTIVTQEPGFPGEMKQEMLDIDLKDLEVVATLGIGGFGRVELVKCEKNGTLRTFALKCLKKKHIVETKQEEHVYNERKIMLSCNTSFICRLYRTYRDSKYVYMLLEACLGGEVWTILRDKGNFDEATTKFIIGCVLEAFDYLHSRGIVYRDLKPENLMLDANGYVKLVDFGFAKCVGIHSNKTWTFCGTPEYVAPEIILNKGHDRAVDCWSLGILIHELLTGTPPFAAQDPMKTYNLILKGIDIIDFPRHMSKTAISLIKRLCRDVPAERLGYQRAGIQEIKKHKWFQGFDWDGLSSLTLTPPIVQHVNGPTDSSNFDEFPSRTEVPPDELSGWDMNF